MSYRKTAFAGKNSVQRPSSTRAPEKPVSYVTVHSLHELYNTIHRERKQTSSQPSPQGSAPASAAGRTASPAMTAGSLVKRSVSGGSSSGDAHFASATAGYDAHTGNFIGDSLEVKQSRAFHRVGPSVTAGPGQRNVSNSAEQRRPGGSMSGKQPPSQHDSESVPDESVASSAGYKNQGTTINAGDRVIIADSAEEPGVPLVYRTPEERAYNIQRLNLDKRQLEVIPVLQGEDELRLLNFQHNHISRMERLGSFRKLVFIDLYNNKIEEIDGLDELRGLRVLMLGKNRIRNISNLHSLHKLDVLDLHGNLIEDIDNLAHLAELRVLNLAGNQIAVVRNLSGLHSLAELNLRRNHITYVKEVDCLPVLQRLFLSFNRIQSFEDIECLSQAQALSEVTLDGNPFAETQNYKMRMMLNMSNLRQLDMKRVTDEEKRNALIVSRKEEEKKREMEKSVAMKERKRAAIANAAKQWDELMKQHQGTGGSKPSSRSCSGKNKLPALDLPPASPHSNMSRQDSARSTYRSSAFEERPPPPPPPPSDKPGPAGGECDISNSHLADIDGEVLNLYGTGSVSAALDKNWGVQAAGVVSTISFKFIDYDEIAPQFARIRARFPNVSTLIFEDTNIRHLSQLNALSQLRKLDYLHIKSSGNPIVRVRLWTSYVLFRHNAFSIKKINDHMVTPEDVSQAERLFGGITSIQALLSSICLTPASNSADGAKKKSSTASDSDLRKAGKHSVSNQPQGNSAENRLCQLSSLPLQYLSDDRKAGQSNELTAAKSVCSRHLSSLVRDVTSVDQRTRLLHHSWDAMFTNLVTQYSSWLLDSDKFVTHTLAQLDISDI